MKNPKIILKPVKHYEDWVTGIYFDGNYSLHVQVKRIDGVRYSRTCGCWYSASADIGKQLKLLFGDGVSIEDLREPEEPVVPVPDSYEELLTRRRYSDATKRNYVAQFSKFLRYARVPAAEITEVHIRDYMAHLIKEGLSVSTQNTVINAIKLYLEQIEGNERKFYYLERPIKEEKLPVVMSAEEVMAVVKSCANIKHRALLLMTYSAGLRRSEVLALRKVDIDEAKRMVWVRQGKGNKDRFTLLSDKMVVVLKQYYELYDPKEYVFESKAGEPYTESSLQKVFRTAVERAGIKKEVTLHGLRHSFATHLLESGVDLRYIQALLGHNNSKTTERYTHVTKKGFGNIRSPLDNLDL